MGDQNTAPKTTPDQPPADPSNTDAGGTPDVSAQLAEMREIMQQQAQQIEAMKAAQVQQAETFKTRLRETATGGIISRLGELDDETRADIDAVLSSGITVDGETMQVDAAAAEARLARILAVGRRQALAEIEAAKTNTPPPAPKTVVLTPPPAHDPPTPKTVEERLDEHAAKIAARYTGGGE